MSKRKPTSIIRQTLDLTKRHFTRVKNGFEIIGTWYQNEDTHWRWKPCLVIMPAEKWGRRVTPVIIPETEAWRWALQKDVGDPFHCLQKAAEWFQEGILPGTAFNKRDHMRLYDAINDNLRDLQNIPPRERGDTAVIGDVTIHKPTGEIIEREVRQDV